MYLAVVAAFTAVLTIRSVLDRAWVVAVFAGLAVVVVVLLVRSGPVMTRAQRAERSRAAVSRCDPERVQTITADAGAEEVKAVRLLRKAEPHLSLIDAVALVRDRPPS